MRDPHKALAREIGRRHPDLTLVTSRSEPWASVTFTGERHVFTFAVGAPPVGLEETEFALSGHIVADLSVAQTTNAIVIEALTIQAD